ncbi:MAG: Holliday junction branch migration protein RuvA [Gemmatimonadota bacterium]
MISRLKGTLVANELDTLEVETQGGVVYEVEVPLTVLSHVPRLGSPIELRTLQVVREDSVALYGFIEAHEREMFRRLLTAPGVGPKLALAMLSAMSARRLARALVDKEYPVLMQISGVGRKKAEKLVLELAGKVEDLAGGAAEDGVVPAAGQEAVRALVALGIQHSEAEAAVRAAVATLPNAAADQLIRQVLAERAG